MLIRALTIFGLTLAGCTATGPERRPPRASPEVAVRTAPPPPATARTADEFDTTTAAQREEAATAAPAPEAALGEVVVSLGDPAEAGLWLRTPLVETRRPGRVASEAGATALVDLIPDEGGSRISLAAMRLLDLPLTELARVEVFAR